MSCRLLFWLIVCAVSTGCATKAGFNPQEDAAIAIAKAQVPQEVKGDLSKQDPRESLQLQTDPSTTEGYDIINVTLKDIPPQLSREIEDPRRRYDKYRATIEVKNGEYIIRPECKDKKPDCTEFKDVKVDRVLLHRKVWRAALYGPDGKVERLYDALWRPKLQRFVVLLPLHGWTEVIGKELRIWSAYGDFVIKIDGTLLPLPNRDAARLPQEVRAHASIVRRDMVLSMSRADAAGEYFLDVVAQEFPLPAPFHKGAAHPDIYLGAVKLTREDNAVDCWVGNGGGSVLLSPIPALALKSFAVSVLWSLPRVTSRDCGKK